MKFLMLSIKAGQTRSAAMMLLTMLTLMLQGTGCKTVPQVDVISSDRMVVTVHKGVPFSPPEDGKFVPLARYIELKDAYIRASFQNAPH